MNSTVSGLTLMILGVVVVALSCVALLIWPRSIAAKFMAVAIFLGLGFIVWFAVRNKAWAPTAQPIVVSSLKFGTLDTAIVQIHGGVGIYDTSFFVKQTDRWVWYYLDHDGGYWSNANVRTNNATGDLEVLHDGILAGIFKPETGVFRNLKNGQSYPEPNGYIIGDIVHDWNARRYDVEVMRSRIAP